MSQWDADTCISHLSSLINFTVYREFTMNLIWSISGSDFAWQGALNLVECNSWHFKMWFYLWWNAPKLIVCKFVIKSSTEPLVNVTGHILPVTRNLQKVSVSPKSLYASHTNSPESENDTLWIMSLWTLPFDTSEYAGSHLRISCSLWTQNISIGGVPGKQAQLMQTQHMQTILLLQSFCFKLKDLKTGKNEYNLTYFLRYMDIGSLTCLRSLGSRTWYQHCYNVADKHVIRSIVGIN